MYRSVQQWNHWLTHFLGSSVLDAEKNCLSTFFGDDEKYTLLIGVPNQHLLFHGLKKANHPHRVVLGPLMNKNHDITYVESGLDQLPIMSGSVNKVILPHTLEWIENPRQLLSEACRMVKPEGSIIIFGFNPFSFWGVKKWWEKSKMVPWSGNFIQPAMIRKWLALAEFELLRQEMLLFRPPVHSVSFYQKLKWMDWLGHKCNGMFGGVFAITAKAKTIPLTPIKLRWGQTLTQTNPVVPLPGST